MLARLVRYLDIGAILLALAVFAAGIAFSLQIDISAADHDQLLVGQPASTKTPFPTTTATVIPTTTPKPSPTVMVTPPPAVKSYAQDDQGIVVIAPIPTPDGSTAINGVERDAYLVMPDYVLQHVRMIHKVGQAMGRDPQAFSKLGDSTIENPHFLARFDGDFYNLGVYDYLQTTVDHFSGSFAREGAVRRGLHTWSVLDPMWAGGDCLPGEHLLACEIRLHNPSVMLIRLGSNDRGVPDSTERALREIVAYCLERGVIPVLGTKADRFEGAGDINNAIIRRVAAEYAVPLWDFDLLAATIPGRGLTVDNVHMTTFFAHDWRQASAFRTGHGVHSLSALVVLDAIRGAVGS